MTSLVGPSVSQSDLRVKRKPPPFLDLSVAERYPPPDPSDPFAPLWVLRSRTSSAQLLQRQTIYNLSTDGRRQSAFNPQHGSHTANFSEDDVRCVVSDSEHTYPRRSARQARARQRSQSMALLTSGTPSTYEFPSVSGRHDRLLAGLNERSYSSTDIEHLDKWPRALHITSDTNPAQKKLSQLLKPKKLSTLMYSHSPRVHKASISGPVLASKPPAVKTISLTLQTSMGEPQRSAIPPSVTRNVSRRNHSTPLLPTRVASNQQPSSAVAQLPSAVSHSAFIHISYPTPSTAYPQIIHENAYTSPRPAPKPPQKSTTPLPLTVTNENTPRKTPSQPQVKGNKSKPLPVTPPIPQPEWARPTREQLTRAASLLVIAESGIRVTFGSLFAKQRTIVIFIRHFWCPLCQDYMSSVRSFVRPDLLKSLSSLGSEGGLPPKLVIVSNGSPAMISKYRQIFRMPFDMYTDPTLAVYTALGMGRGKSETDQPECPPKTERIPKNPVAADKQKRDDATESSGYVKHGTVGGIVLVALRALKVGMPVWEKGGDVAQLGGEFVFGPGLTCSYAHRMQSAKGHAPIQDVVKAALEAASKGFGAERMKPLPAVSSSGCDTPTHPSTGSPKVADAAEKDVADDGSYSYELVSDETHMGARETHEEQDVSMEADGRERIAASENEYGRCLAEEIAAGLGQHDDDEECTDDASVAATCSDTDRSEEGAMQHSTESECETLDEGDQIDAKFPEGLKSPQLNIDSAN